MTAVVETKNLVAGYLPGVNILNGTEIYVNQGVVALFCFKGRK